MRSSLTLACLLCLSFLSARAPAQDLLITHARAYTMDAERGWANTVLVRDGKIAYVGDRAGADLASDTAVRRVDLGGRMLLPAFQDAHAHIASGGVAYTDCPVFDLPDREAILAAIRRCVEADPQAPIIRGAGWSITQFENDRPPRREALDDIDDRRPLVFEDADGHALWLNSAALDAYGITQDMPDPPGGRIERDPDTGALWGTLHEESAMNLVWDKWPPIGDEEIIAGLEHARDYYHSLGITALQEAMVGLDRRDAYRSLPAFAAMVESGELKLRVSLALAWRSGGGQAQLDAFLDARKRYDSDDLKVNMVKFWADGVIETRTARLLEPYSDAPGTRGLMMIPREELMEWVPRVDAAGFQVHLHAIGDATVRYGLDAIEAAWARNGRRDARHHINHLQFIHPDDIPRFAALGVGASFQPYWAYEDDYITHFTRPRVGPERIRWTYPIASVLESGARVAFSSDWSVSSANPMLGMETAITRVDPHGNRGEAFLPSERIALVDAIAAYTIHAAYLGDMDKTTGSIEAGKFADLVVLDRNLFEIPVRDISEVRVLATLLGGEVVYGSLD